MGKGRRLRADRARERRHEDHARVKIERAGDPAYSQRRVTETGVEYQLTPDVAAELRGQGERFKERFGREPGPDDPLMFDPDVDIPTPISDDKIKAEFRRAIVAGGLDPAYADAYDELGYMVTEMNVQTFTAHEVDAWYEAVERSHKRAEGAADRDQAG